MKDILKLELIGVNMKVVNSENKSNIGINGRIVDETKNTISVKTPKGIKKLMKKQNTFQLESGNMKFIIKGELLMHRPEERIKLRTRK